MTSAWHRQQVGYCTEHNTKISNWGNKNGNKWLVNRPELHTSPSTSCQLGQVLWVRWTRFHLDTVPCLLLAIDSPRQSKFSTRVPQQCCCLPTLYISLNATQCSYIKIYSHRWWTTTDVEGMEVPLLGSSRGVSLHMLRLPLSRLSQPSTEVPRQHSQMHSHTDDKDEADDDAIGFS